MERILMIAIGGLLPALAFGLAAIFQKAAALQGVQIGTYLVYVGLVAMLGGFSLRLAFAESGWALAGAPFALFAGVGMAIGMGGISFAVARLSAPISLLAPITVLSTLVTVVIGLIVFREYGQISAFKVMAGAVLVVAGAALVAGS